MVNKIAATATQLTAYIFLHAYSRTTAAPIVRAQSNFITHI